MAMEKYQLIQKHAKSAGLKELRVQWINLPEPTADNDPLQSGSVDFEALAPPPFLIAWDKTLGSANVKGVAAISSVPMYLNVRSDHLRTLNDIRVDDRIAVPAVKVSLPAILMQMYAGQRYGISDVPHFDPFTAAMTNPNGVLALLSGGSSVDGHFTLPPYHQRERRDPSVRTILTSDEVLGGPATFALLATSEKFRQRNPKVYAAVFAALEDADQMMASDRPAAARLLFDSMNGGGFTVNEVEQILKDPAIRFTTTPENLMKYAKFMNEVGTIKNQPSSWKDLFFPEVQALPGS